MRNEDMAVLICITSAATTVQSIPGRHTAGAPDAFRNYRRRMKPRTARRSDAVSLMLSRSGAEMFSG